MAVQQDITHYFGHLGTFHFTPWPVQRYRQLSLSAAWTSATLSSSAHSLPASPRVPTHLHSNSRVLVRMDKEEEGQGDEEKCDAPVEDKGAGGDDDDEKEEPSSLLGDSDMSIFDEDKPEEPTPFETKAKKKKSTQRPAPSDMLMADLVALESSKKPLKRLQSKKEREKKRPREEQQSAADEPAAKKKRVLVMPGAEEAPERPSLSLVSQPTEKTLADVLFGEDDLDSADLADALDKATASKSKKTKDRDDADRMELDEPDEASSSKSAKAKPAEAPLPRVTATEPGIYEQWPVIFGDVEELYVRATFATSGDRTMTPLFTWPKTTARGEAPPKPLPATAWGIFVLHENVGSDTDSSSGVARSAPTFESMADDLLQEDEAEAPDAMQLDANPDADGQAGGAAAADGDDLVEEMDDVNRPSKVTMMVDLKKPASAQPWFVIVVPSLDKADLLKTISSPFFYSRVRMVAVDSRRATFGLQPRARIFMLYEVLEKHAVWPTTLHYNWTVKQAMRILLDTLYVAVESLMAKTPSTTLVDVLSRVLAGFIMFPLHKNPMEKLLPLSSVPINDYSDRRERAAWLQERFRKRVTENDIGQAMIKGVPLVEVIGLDQCGLWRRPFLFSHLEKPLSTWLLLERGVPATALASLTSWNIDGPRVVGERAALLRPLFAPRLSDVKNHELLSLARHFRLDPAWFADWFDTLETTTAKAKRKASTPPGETGAEDADLVVVEGGEEGGIVAGDAEHDQVHQRRLEIYAIFCASALWHHFFDMKQRYGANYTYILTTVQCRQWLESTSFYRSEFYAERQRVANTLTADEAPSPLPIEDRNLLKDKIGAFVKKLVDVKPPTPTQGKTTGVPLPTQCVPRMVTLGPTSSALVDTSVHRRVTNLCMFFVETCIMWKQSKERNALAAPFDQLPPILVQSLYLYGPGTVRDAKKNPYETFYDALKSATAQLPQLSAAATLPLPPPRKPTTAPSTTTVSAPLSSPKSTTASAPKRICFVIRAAANASQTILDLRRDLSKIYVLVFDRFHLWPEHLIDSVLAELTHRDRTKYVTHLVITLNDHTLLDLNASGMLQADIMEFALTIQRKLGCSSAPTGAATPFFPRHRGVVAGQQSLEGYPFEHRDAQFKENVLGKSTAAAATPVRRINDGSLVQHHKTFQALVASMAAAASEAPGSPMLILVALPRTETEIQRRLDAIDPNWRTSGGASIGTASGGAAVRAPLATFSSYETFARAPSRLTGAYNCVVLCDLDYKGAGRPTFHHINAALERCTTSLQVYKSGAKGGTAVAPMVTVTEAENMISDVFFNNDAKTDRLETQGQRLPLLKYRLTELLYSSKLGDLL